jgi:hypothetical protein
MGIENGWNEWSKHVLKELERLNSCYTGLDKEVKKIHIELVKLQVKSGLWGAAAGAIPVIIMLLVQYIRK